MFGYLKRVKLTAVVESSSGGQRNQRKDNIEHSRPLGKKGP